MTEPLREDEVQSYRNGALSKELCPCGMRFLATIDAKDAEIARLANGYEVTKRVSNGLAAEIGHVMTTMTPGGRFDPTWFQCSCGYESAATAMDLHLHTERMFHAEAALDAALAKVARLEAAILDIDAHSTPLGQDEDGFVSTGYAISVGCLHRALGLVGKSAALSEPPMAHTDRGEGEPRMRKSFRGTPVVCGAGHLCCDDPSEPPLHDHFLRQEECPRCARMIAADRSPREAMEGGE